MPAGFKVRWTSAAELDLLRIIEYIANDSVVNAAALSKRIRRRGASLRKSPMRGRVVPELADFGARVYRELLEPPYRIVYFVEEQTVYVRAVLDGRRDLQQVFEEWLGIN